MTEAVQKMHRFPIQAAIQPMLLIQGIRIGIAGIAQCAVDQVPLAQFEASVFGSQTARQFAQHPVVGAAFGIRLDNVTGDLQIGVATAKVDVIVFQKRSCGQHDIRHAGGFGQKLLVHTDK